jgi:hypothetical protein
VDGSDEYGRLLASQGLCSLEFGFSVQFSGLRAFSRGLSGRGVKLTIHVYLVPKLRMRGAIVHSLGCLHGMTSN